MFAEYGSDQTVVLSAGGTLTQSIIEDSSVRSAMNMGAADRLVLDPISLSAYNKIAHAKERIMLAGSAQEATGAHLRTQWTSSAVVSLEASRFLSGKTRPARARLGALLLLSIAVADAGAAGSLLIRWYVCVLRNGSVRSVVNLFQLFLKLHCDRCWRQSDCHDTAVSGAPYYNVYRSDVGDGASDAKFIGKIAQGSGNPAFIDLGNRQPGSVTGFLIQGNTLGIRTTCSL